LESRSRYFWIFIIFGIVFVASALFWLGNAAAIQDSDFVADPDKITAASIALATAVISLLGTVLTLFLTVRKERREQELAQIALERQRLELKQERLELESLKLQLEEKKRNKS